MVALEGNGSTRRTLLPSDGKVLHSLPAHIATWGLVFPSYSYQGLFYETNILPKALLPSVSHNSWYLHCDPFKSHTFFFNPIFINFCFVLLFFCSRTQKFLVMHEYRAVIPKKDSAHPVTPLLCCHRYDIRSWQAKSPGLGLFS